MSKIPAIPTQKWGEYQGKDILLYTLTNRSGIEISITNFGAIITSVKIPAKGEKIECVLGFDTFEEYLSEEYRKEYPYLGAVIGRNAGRIKDGKTFIDDKPVQLTCNHQGSQLHGGHTGFDSVVWDVVETTASPLPSVTLQYLSKDGEEGYPGNLTATVTYTLLEDNSLQINYGGSTDKPTIFNLTQHAYFNFNHGEGDILNHILTINSDKYVPLQEGNFTPTGEILKVENTPLDYRNGAAVYEHTDNSFVREIPADQCIGSVTNAENTITMEVRTNYPVLHIYAGFWIPELSPKGRKKCGKNAGLCFEAQGLADAQNHPHFRSTLFYPNQKYNYHTNFKFIF
ncbi:MAG: aldose epimerase family protein [Capnocytophaga sp.]|nr:aldose epimerase family protein [Capnocytophaga sp.]